MRVKLNIACAVLAALAAAAPATALASPELQTSGGAKVAVGTAITGTNVAPVVYTTAGSVGECSSAHLTGTVRTNSGSLVELKIESFEITGGSCTGFVFENLPWCLSTSVLKAWVLKGGGCEKENVPLAYSLGGGACKYQLGSMANVYQEKTSPLHLESANDQTFTKVSGLLCEPKTVFHWLWKLTTAEGGELKIV